MKEEQAKYKIGDKVEIINFGSLLFENKHSTDPKLNFKVYAEDENFRYLDMNPELIGKIGIITKVSGGEYAINGIPGKSAWYNELQLKLKE